MNTNNQNTLLCDAIIPAAGKGTRFLPFTKAVPKELLPLLGTPAIHHIIKELYAANLTRTHIITHPSKTALHKYFEHDDQLNSTHYPDIKELKELDSLCNTMHISYINQHQQKGLGHAILQAQHAITNPFFAAILPDDILIGSEYSMQTLTTLFNVHACSIIAVQEVPANEVSRYGIISFKEKVSDTVFRLSDVIEKPKIADAPSRYAIIGRYILSSDIFPILDSTKPGSGGEIQLTDGIKTLINSGHTVLACVVPQERFDIGNPAGWLKATLSFALKDPLLASIVRSAQ